VLLHKYIGLALFVVRKNQPLDTIVILLFNIEKVQI